MTGYVALGKYSNAIEEALHNMAMDGWATDDYGDSSDYGMIGWTVTIKPQDATWEVPEVLDSLKLGEFIPDASAMVGYWIVQEDDRGLVWTQRYDSEDYQQQEWRRLVGEYHKFMGWDLDELQVDSEVTLAADTVGGCNEDVTIPAGAVGWVHREVDDEPRHYAVHFDPYVDAEGVTVTLYLTSEDVL